MDKTFWSLWNGRQWVLSVESCLAAVLAILVCCFPLHAGPPLPNALPTGAQVMAGQASINQQVNRMNITQTTPKLITNWQTFNIGSNAAVNFQQPNASSVALNRVLSADPSKIYGSLTANGQLFLLNPGGVIFGKGARIDVGGLAVSTLNMKDSNFLAGKYTFEKGLTAGAIRNDGKIQAANGGYLAFIAPRIENNGEAIANQGAVAMAAGDKVSLDFSGDKLINFTIDKGTVDALVANKGLIKADGGEVVLTAKAANKLTQAVVNNSGIIQAKTLENKAGRILLISDMESGETIAGGTLDASAPNGGDGGFIETSAAKVSYGENFTVTAGALFGTGGLWLIDPADTTIDQTAANGYATTLNTGTSVENAVTGNITMNDNVSIAKTAGNDATLTFKASGSITLGASTSISSTLGKLNVVLWADTDADSGGGFIATSNPSSITTNGGHLWMGGGSGSTTWNGLTVGNGYAVGNSTNSNGILIRGATINTGGGNIAMYGKSRAGVAVGGDSNVNAEGIRFARDSNASINSGTGNIYMEGISLGTSGWNDGVAFDKSGSTTHSVTSAAPTGNAITIVGDGSGVGAASSSSGGVWLHPNATISATGGGSISITGTGGSTSSYNDAIWINNSSGTSTIDAGTGELTLVGRKNAINVPYAILKGGATSLIAETTDHATRYGITANNASNDFTGAVSVVGSNVNLRDTNAIQLGASTITGNLTLQSNGAITQSGAISVAGTTSITAGSTNNVALTNTGNDFTGAVSLVSGAAESIKDANSISIGTSNVTGDLTVEALGGDVTIAGNVSKTSGADATATFKATGSVIQNSSISIASSSNKLHTVLWADSDVSGGGYIQLGKNAPITTKGGHLWMGGGSNTATWKGLTVGDGYAQGTTAMPHGIYISNGVVSTSGGDIAMYGKSATTVTTSSASPDSQSNAAGIYGSFNEQYSINSGTGTIYMKALGAVTSAHGSFSTADSFYLNGGSITSSAGSGDAITLIGDATAVNYGSVTRGCGMSIIGWNAAKSNTISATGGGNIVMSGTGTPQNTSSYNYGIRLSSVSGGSNTITTSNGGNIVLTGVANDTTALSSTGFETSSDKITSGGNLTVNGTGKPINLLGETVVSGATTFSVSGQNITANNASNDFTGAVSIVGSNVNLRDTNAIQLGASTITGNLTLQSGGAITQSGAISVAGTTSITAGSTNNVTLTDTGNDFTGAVTVTVGKNITLLDANDMTLGAVTSTGTVDIATLTGDLTLSGNITTTDTTANAIKLNAGKNTAAGTATGGDILISGSPTISTSTGGFATLYSGSTAGSTGLTTSIGSGSGRFRYNSDETATNYTTALTTGKNAIYREQPTLTVTPSSQTITYGDATPAFSATVGTAYANGDSSAGTVSGTATWTVGGTTSTSGSYTAGNHDVSYFNGLASSLGYGFVDNGTSKNELTVNQKSLTVSGITANSKVYDAGVTATLGGTAAITPLLTDVVTLGGTPAGAFADKNVGTGKAVTVTGNTISGADANNYNLIQQTGLTANITKADLAVTGLTASNKVYDTTTTAALTGTAAITPLLTDVVTLGGTPAGAFADKNVGTGKAVTVTGNTISGADANNYNLIQQTGLTANITKANLAVTGLTASNKVYDTTRTATLGGTAAVDALGSDVVTLGGTAAGTFADKNVGTGKAVTVTGNTISGTDAGNYTLVQQTGLTANITKADLTAGLTGTVSKTYDGGTAATLAAGNYTLSGVIGSDTVTLNNPAAGTYDTKNAGVGKTVTVTGLAIAGADAANYSLFSTTTNGGVGTITARTLNVTYTGVNKVYDGNTTATVNTSDDRVTSDTLTINRNAAFLDKNVASGKTVSVTGVSLSDTDAGNYTVAATGSTTADITKAPLTITATTNTKIYDGGMTASAVPTVAGLKGSDTVTGLTEAYTDKNAGTGKALSVSAYTVNDNNSGGNYTVTTVADTTGVINKAPLTITADDKSKTYGDLDPVLTERYSGLVAGETASVVSGLLLSAPIGAAATAGTHVIGISGGTANNYVITLQNGTLTVAKAMLTATADDKSKSQGSGDPELTYTANGFRYIDGPGNVFTGAISRTSGEAAGEYPITQGSLVPNSNYTLTFNNGKFTITPVITVLATSINTQAITPVQAPVLLSASGVELTLATSLVSSTVDAAQTGGMPTGGPAQPDSGTTGGQPQPGGAATGGPTQARGPAAGGQPGGPSTFPTLGPTMAGVSPPSGIGSLAVAPVLPVAPAPQAERIVLLPDAEGRTGSVVVKTAKGEVVLDKPYQTAVLTSQGEIETKTTDPAEVQNWIGATLTAQPMRPISFIIYFKEGKDALTDESKPTLEQCKTELLKRSSPEVTIIGHTDRVGSITYNDALSLKRADSVRKSITKADIAVAKVEVVGRGEREPIVPTKDGVPEPRNRRVEINVR